MKFVFKFLLSSLTFLIQSTNSFITNANIVIKYEQVTYSEILEKYNLPCHLTCSRVKTFNSALTKMKNINTDNIYNLHDLIAFRFVFYTKEDLYKFYHHIKQKKNIMYYKNYMLEPKDNGYSAVHIRYQNIYKECPIKQLECQMYIIEDYYDSIYGNSQYSKNYTNFF